jgi:hypothetical protein
LAESASKKGKQTTENKKKDASVKQQIGTKLMAVLAEGQNPDDALLVSLLVDTLIQEPEKSGGFIILDFPCTINQAQLLERELSGYEDPKPVKKGDLKRTKDRQASSNHRNRSLIAGTDAAGDPIPVSPVSGLDGIFLMENSSKNSISRAVGRVIDPITGKNFHIEFNPPPITEPVHTINSGYN